jgi:hypothetical protein
MATVNRQEVLVLYLSNSSLDSRVVSWTRYNSPGRSSEVADEPEPPYATGVAALEDGWRLIQAAQLVPANAGMEYAISFQKFEFWLERLNSVEVADASSPVSERAGARP